MFRTHNVNIDWATTGFVLTYYTTLRRFLLRRMLVCLSAREHNIHPSEAIKHARVELCRSTSRTYIRRRGNPCRLPRCGLKLLTQSWTVGSVLPETVGHPEGVREIRKNRRVGRLRMPRLLRVLFDFAGWALMEKTPSPNVIFPRPAAPTPCVVSE